MSMKRCQRCILPETAPGISFDSHGVCNYCRNYRKIRYLGEEKLSKHIEHAKQQNGAYDCLVPISGGRDSTYVLFVAKKKYHLKTLAVNFDNEFRVEQALNNIQSACKILGVDLEVYKSKRNLAKKIVTDSLKYYPNYGLRDCLKVCYACSYGYKALAYHAAEKHKIPLILWGSSRIEKTVHLTSPSLGKSLSKEMARRFNLLSFHNLRLLSHKYLQRLELPAPGNLVRTLYLHTPILKNGKIRELSLYDYIPWERRKIKETITSELGWRKPEGALSSWRIDCQLKGLITYCYQNIFGCSKNCFGYYNMINENEMIRDEALELEEKTLSLDMNALRAFLEGEIGLSRADILKLDSYRKKSLFPNSLL